MGAHRAGERARAAAGLRRGGDGVAHDDAARPLREHAAHDHCHGRRGRRRRRQRLRAALHAGDRPARPLGAAGGAQHAAHPVGGVEPLPRRRSGCRLRRHRGADRRAGADGVDAVPGDRGRGRRRGGARKRPHSEKSWRHARGPPGHYRNLGEASVKVLDVARVAAPPLALAVTFEPLPSLRMAEPYERLRDASDRFLKKTGARPKVFLANLGTPSDFTARSTFAKNFYEAGGIEALSNDGFKDRAAMLAAFKASGAKLACLCSSDKVYEAQAADAAKALTAAGAIVQLAGRGGDHEAAWRQAGVKTFVFMGCDALSTLRETHGILTDSGHARA